LHSNVPCSSEENVNEAVVVATSPNGPESIVVSGGLLSVEGLVATTSSIAMSKRCALTSLPS
jgi:hypothetical protein